MYKGTILQDASSCPPPVSVSTKILRLLFWSVFAIYGVLAVAFLGLRYWVLPRADQWRPQIEQYASQALGSRVAIDSLSADWSGLNPRLNLSGVRIYDHQADPVLSLPSVAAVLGWRSVLKLSPTLQSLRIDGADLLVRRDSADRLWVAGQSIDLAAPSDHGFTESPALRWLARQRELALHGVTLRWQDEARQAPELRLDGLDLLMRNGVLSHRFSLRVRPPAQLAAKVSLRGELNRSLFARDGSNPASWSGQLYAEVQDAEPAAWAPWVAMPAAQGRYAARAWLQLDHGKFTDLTMDAALRGLNWRAGQSASVSVDSAQWRLQGAPGDLLQFSDLPLARSADGAGVSVTGQADGLWLNLPEIFEHPLALDRAQLDATLTEPAGQPLTLNLRRLQLANPDLDATLHGAWRQQGKSAAGTADLRGSLARASMPAIHRYLPLEVNEDARLWLATGLPAGTVHDATITLAGDLDDFPFSEPGAQGQFRIAGRYQDAVVDYAPAEGKRKAWPRLEQLSGNFAVDKVSLSLDSAGGGLVRTAADQVVSLGAVKAAIPDMEDRAQLHVEGQSSGAVPAYLALAANSPLGELLDGALAEAEGTGQWEVPLALDVPLLNAEDTKVEGRIVFAGNAFRFMPEMPMLTQLRGELAFSELGMSAKEIHARFLGGPARIWGVLEQGSAPLRFEGTLTAAGLGEVSKAPALKRLSGQSAYRGQLNYLKGGAVDIAMESNLDGLAIDMPAPVGKPARGAMPFKLQWGPANDRGPRGRRWLSGSLAENINVLLEYDPADASRAYFARGALGVNRAASLPQRGLTVAATLPELDLDAWDAMKADFDEPSSGRRQPSRVPLLPQPDQINLAADRLRVAGYTLDDLKLAAQRPTASQWRVTVDSRQALGTLEWTEASGAIAGRVTGRFKRLALAGEEDTRQEEDALSAGNDLEDIPAIDLQAEEFSLYGKQLGSLQLIGTNMERGRLWRLDKLQIANDAARLDATGNWRLDGTQRGLTVQANAEFSDLGKFLDRVGLPQTVGGGKGSLEGTVTWRNLPWSHNLAELEGKARVSLDNGRFLHVNSRAARLLELLSLQSLQRLARLDANPGGLLREGFPFDTIRGDMSLSQGVLTTEGYKLSGPVAGIVLAGNTNIVDERWDMRAVVVPNLDASGAAAVTAALVNPLIGLGAFVTQWLLKQPLARAMSSEYAVTGTWDDPKVTPVESRAPTRQQEPQPEH
ncbi:conserved hypothetical protein [Bordetella bronchiseptica MO149]|uniref:YhdP family protein n=1 Tax=Bordetella bronchiseptica TaxID=518 RepID=UPI00028B80CE|nr:YhdP family protein [Bordetella bronchiseptica]QET72490.1 TIGR02099 family protein [Bordetella bronchiseptica]CCJ58675.1 conserved hypothetical protein [Bordetella bronchiseptica MO149]